MSLLNLRNVFRKLVNWYVTGEYKYVTPVEPIVPEIATIMVGDTQLEGPKETILVIESVIKRLELLNESIAALQEYNNQAFLKGCVHGRNMEKAKLQNTLAVAKQLLLDQIQPIGVVESRVPQFIDWYERIRESAVNPKQDVVTYRTCKTILELDEAMREISEADVQLT